jgi:hypothetical protein
MYYCHRVSTQLQLNLSYHIKINLDIFYEKWVIAWKTCENSTCSTTLWKIVCCLSPPKISVYHEGIYDCGLRTGRDVQAALDLLKVLYKWANQRKTSRLPPSCSEQTQDITYMRQQYKPLDRLIWNGVTIQTFQYNFTRQIFSCLPVISETLVRSQSNTPYHATDFRISIFSP